MTAKQEITAARELFCYEWFANTEREDWNNNTIESVRDKLQKHGAGQSKSAVKEIFEIMVRIIAEYDAQN